MRLPYAVDRVFVYAVALLLAAWVLVPLYFIGLAAFSTIYGALCAMAQTDQIGRAHV